MCKIINENIEEQLNFKQIRKATWSPNQTAEYTQTHCWFIIFQFVTQTVYFPPL